MKKIPIPVQAEDPDHIPEYATPDASGADLKAAIETDIRLQPGRSLLIPTGIKIAIPKGYEVQIRPRSGFALKNQVTVLNTPGTIDADYRGEIKVILINHGQEDFIITPYMRIAQFVLAPVCIAEFQRQEQELAETTRDRGGFGHTGSH